MLKWQPGGIVTRVLTMRSAGERGRTASSGSANRRSIALPLLASMLSLGVKFADSASATGKERNQRDRVRTYCSFACGKRRRLRSSRQSERRALLDEIS